MDRQLLVVLYAAGPRLAFERAFSESPVSGDCYRFFCEKAEELPAEHAIRLLTAEVEDGVELVPGPALRRLATLIVASARANPEHPFSCVRDLLGAAGSVDPAAWRQDLVLPLARDLQPRQWYALVAEARGGALFRHLIEALLESPRHGAWSRQEITLIRADERKPDASIVRALEVAHNDLELAKLAFEVLTTRELLVLHRQLPELIREEGLRRVADARAELASDCFASTADAAFLPDWFIPIVERRLRYCEDEEARILYDWLFTSARLAEPSVAFEIALHRLKGSVVSLEPGDGRWRYWSPLVGKHLTTGRSWKTRGRDLIRFCIEAGHGFPEAVLDAALDAARESDGATSEDHRAAMVRLIHDETAKLLVEFAERAIESRETGDAARYLSAFLCLDPGSFVAVALHRLSTAELSPELRERVAACVALTRLGHRAPTKEAFIEAFRVLLGQAS